MEREHHESYLREQHRQRMARLQANDAAYDSPVAVDLSDASAAQESAASSSIAVPPVLPRTSALDLYASALQHGLSGHDADPNGQGAKKRFFNEDIKDARYLSSRVVPKISPYELKRGSVIPATLITGINSDLPGQVTAQVSQNVYDSATGRHLLIAQGSKLFGRYDSNVSFGQGRVLVVWTDIIFPDGSTLQLEGMAGTDAGGYSGFKDRINNHYLRTFGSAILVALIGTGTEMLLPSKANRHNDGNSAEDSARRSFGETLGQMSQQTHLEEPRRSADTGDQAGLPVQCHGRKGHHLSRAVSLISLTDQLAALLLHRMAAAARQFPTWLACSLGKAAHE